MVKAWIIGETFGQCTLADAIPRGHLRSSVSGRRNFGLQLKIASEAAAGLAHLHALETVHRNVCAKKCGVLSSLWSSLIESASLPTHDDGPDWLDLGVVSSIKHTHKYGYHIMKIPGNESLMGRSIILADSSRGTIKAVSQEPGDPPRDFVAKLACFEHSRSADETKTVSPPPTPTHAAPELLTKVPSLLLSSSFCA